MHTSTPTDPDTVAKLVDALDCMEEAFVVYDKDGYLVECNNAFKRLYNYTDEQAKPGIHFRELGVIDIENGNVAIGTTGGEDYLALKAEYRKKLQGSFDVLLKDGRWIRTTDRALTNGGFVSVQIEITDQKQAEKTLQENERHLDTLVRTSPAVIYSVDLKTDLSLSFVSQKIETIFGYTVADCMSEQNFWKNRLHPDEADAVVQKMLDNIANKDSFSDEYRFRLPDGSYCWVEDRKNVIYDKDGSAIELVGTWLDITDRKAAELALIEAKEEAQSANRSKSAFLATMSHEIRTPMNGVLGMAELLERTEMGSDQSRMVSSIINSGNSLLRIIDDILDYSKIEAGKLDLNPEEMNLLDTIEGAAILMVPSADANNVRLHLKLALDMPRRIRFDVVRLRQILNNLLSNAIKFSRKPDGHPMGQVTLEVQRLKGNRLQFSVHDNGVGMSDDALSNLFKPFVQAESSTTRRFGGTGLGLSIVKKLVDLIDGSIHVESNVGQGTSFSVTLPFMPTEQPEAEVPHPTTTLFGLFDTEKNRDVIDRNQRFQKTSTMVVAKNQKDLFDRLEEVKGQIIVNLAMGSMDQNRAVQDDILKKHPSAKFVCQTYDRSEKMGLVSANTFVISRFPTLPSEIETATVTLLDHHRLENAQTKKAEKDAPLSPSHSHVLLVEDNLTNQRVIAAQLEALGVQMTLANNGREGFDRWTSGDFDLVLTDCHMPEMDGFELTAKLRLTEEKAQLSRTPVIAITANALRGEAERCIAAGMDDYLSKPVAIADLKDMLGKWLADTPSGRSKRPNP